MSLAIAMLRARYARKTPRRIPIADFSRRVVIRVIRIKRGNKPHAVPSKRESIDGLEAKCVIHCVARYYGLPVARLIAKDQRRQLGLARHVAMYLAKTLTNDSSHKIGKYMGHRDHSTILTGQYKIRVLMATDESVRADVERLTAALRGSGTIEQANAPMVST